MAHPDDPDDMHAAGSVSGEADWPPVRKDDERARAAWRTWLSALATDAEAAIAAALAYEALPGEGRNAWLDALEADAAQVSVPRVALYAPLLAVEDAQERRDRIEGAIAAEGGMPGRPARAFRGVATSGEHVCVIVSPLYLDFVQVLMCRYTPSGGIHSVSHDPLRHADELSPSTTREVEGVAVEATPVPVVVEELAHAILADRRADRAAPEALASFAHLFAPCVDGDEVGEP
jgi:hypothetical protein